jgi:ubiquinone/menaquinone biosynthesis C-methylase UbiE
MFSDPAKNIQQFSLGPHNHVVDFGSGTGAYSLAAAEVVGSDGKVYALDVQKDMLQKLQDEARKRGLNNIEIIWADLDRLNGTKLRPESIDAVIASNVFFQISDKDIACIEIKRILKTGGRVLVVDWLSSFGGLGPESNAVFTEQNARDLFIKHGFAEDRVINAGAHHYGIIFRK